MYKISIIIPVYNTSNFLNKCLDSLINQTLKEIEIILINDGSTDNSQDIINEYTYKYPDKVKAYIKENGGQASARNLGIQKATGEYVAFVDSDDWVELQMYEKLYDTAQKDCLDIVCCNDYMIVNNERKPSPSKTFYSNNINENYILLESGPCNKIIKRDLIIKNNIKFLEDHIYEDLAVIPTLALYTTKIGYIDSHLYNYLVREGSTMNQVIYNKKLEDIFDVMEELSIRFQDNYKDELEYLYIKHLLHAASLRFLKYKEGNNQRKRINKIMKQKFSNWKRNKYFIQETQKYKLLCKLLYINNPIFINIYLMLKNR